jgi:hypothetical protein
MYPWVASGAAIFPSALTMKMAAIRMRPMNGSAVVLFAEVDFMMCSLKLVEKNLTRK